MIVLHSEQMFTEPLEGIECVDLEGLLDILDGMKGDIGVDTETTGFDPYTNRLLTVQIGNASVQTVISSGMLTDRLKGYLRTFFRSSERTFIFHNAKFDLRFLMLLDIWPERVYDTFLAESVIYQGIRWDRHPKGLADVTRKYCSAELDKSIRGNIHWKGLSTDVIEYAANDVKYLPAIKDGQMLRISSEGLERVTELENRFVKVLAYIEMSGMLLDVEPWKRRIEEDRKELTAKVIELDRMVTEDPRFHRYVDVQLDLFCNDPRSNINWSSPAQCVRFFNDLGCDLRTKDRLTGEWKDSVDAKVLTPQRHLHPIIDVYLEYKGIDKLISTYGDNWIDQINPVTGRIHTQFKQMIDTARLSSGGKNSKTREQYINFLNIPQDNRIRNCIIPSNGYVFVDADYSGQESVVLANKSMEPNLIQFYNEDGGDLHSFVASKIYPECASVPLSEVKTKFKAQRQNAKAANFAIAYGGVGATIASNLSIPIEDGDRVYEAYLNAFPKLKQYFAEEKAKVLKNGYILTDNVSMRRIYADSFEEYLDLKERLTPEFWDAYRENRTEERKQLVSRFYRIKGEMERMALNYPIQSTSASITKFACILVYRQIERDNRQFEILFPNVVHDQLILEVPEDEASHWADTVKECMERAGDLFCRTVKLKAEPVVLRKWEK
jgi:DNA polymerase-1